MGKKTIDAPSKTIYMVNPETLVIVGIDTKDGPEHPLYDERIHLPLNKKLAKNIQVRGVIEPVIVRKDGEDLQVVDGRQRVRSCREANIDLAAEGKEEVLVPCLVERGKDQDMVGIMVSTNEHRKDNSPMAKARMLAKYMTMGYTEDNAATEFGVTSTSIKNWLKLLELDESVQKAVDSGQVKASAVAGLHSLPREEQRAKLAEILATGQETGKRPTQRVAEKKSGTESSKTKGLTKRQVLRLLALPPDELWNLGLEEWFVKGLRVAFGDLPVTSVSGLSAALTLADEHAKTKKPKAPKEPKPKKEKKEKKAKKEPKEKKAKAKKEPKEGGPRTPPKKKAAKKK